MNIKIPRVILSFIFSTYVFAVRDIITYLKFNNFIHGKEFFFASNQVDDEEW